MISHHPPNQNQPVDSDKFAFLNLRVLPGKVDYRRAGYILDFEPVAIQKLVALGYLKPLGNNGGTEHKYFSTQTIMQCANDPKWMELAKMSRKNGLGRFSQETFLKTMMSIQQLNLTSAANK